MLLAIEKKAIVLAALAALALAYGSESHADTCSGVTVQSNLTKYDLSGDGLIGYSDLQIFYGEFGSTDVTSPADFNGDGVVNLSDWSLLRKYFGVKNEVVTTVTCR